MPDDRRLDRTGAPEASPSTTSPPVGAKVRVVSGAFTGKSGVVSAPDGKGGIMVALGQLTVRLLIEEVEVVHAAGRERPVLATSHQGKRAGKKSK